MKEPLGDFADPHFHTNGAPSVAAVADETHLREMQPSPQNKGCRRMKGWQQEHLFLTKCPSGGGGHITGSCSSDQ